MSQLSSGKPTALLLALSAVLWSAGCANLAPMEGSGEYASQAPTASPPPVAPADSDGDGVLDSGDLCPGTPRGLSVDSRGCVLEMGSPPGSAAPGTTPPTAMPVRPSTRPRPRPQPQPPEPVTAIPEEAAADPDLPISGEANLGRRDAAVAHQISAEEIKLGNPARLEVAASFQLDQGQLLARLGWSKAPAPSPGSDGPAEVAVPSAIVGVDLDRIHYLRADITCSQLIVCKLAQGSTEAFEIASHEVMRWLWQIEAAGDKNGKGSIEVLLSGAPAREGPYELLTALPRIRPELSVENKPEAVLDRLLGLIERFTKVVNASHAALVAMGLVAALLAGWWLKLRKRKT